MSVTIRELAEWVTRHPRSTTRQILAVKRLAEMNAGAVGDEPAADTMPPDDSEPEDAITGGFKAALMSVIEKALAGNMDPAVALKKIKTLLSAHCDATADDDDNDDDDVDDSDDSDTDSGEDAEKPDAVESRRYGQRERPASASRHRTARFHEDDERPDIMPSDGVAFARWITE